MLITEGLLRERYQNKVYQMGISEGVLSEGVIMVGMKRGLSKGTHQKGNSL